MGRNLLGLHEMPCLAPKGPCLAPKVGLFGMRSVVYRRGMDPIAFHLGSWPVYWYGIFAAAGFLSAIFHWNWLGARIGRSMGSGSDLALWIMLGGVVGARVAFVAANWPQFREAPLSIFALHEGGLIYYGGLAGGVLAVMVFAHVRREPLWPLGDFVVSALPLAHALGRIGCFTRGCCYGALCAGGGWAIEAHGARRHPVQIYEAAANVALYVVILPIVLRRRERPGLAVAAYLALYGCIRLGMEFLRGDERQMLAGLTVAQWISMGLIATGATIFLARSRPAPVHPS